MENLVCTKDITYGTVSDWMHFLEQGLVQVWPVIQDHTKLSPSYPVYTTNNVFYLSVSAPHASLLWWPWWNLAQRRNNDNRPVKSNTTSSTMNNPGVKTNQQDPAEQRETSNSFHGAGLTGDLQAANKQDVGATWEQM